MFRFLFLFAVFTASTVCAQTTVNYTASTTDFVNPERGFYRYTETRSGSYNPLNLNDLQGFSNSYTAGGANYSIVSSLAFRYFFLEDFTGSPISQAYLSQVSADFATARAAGIKVIPRFAYTDNVDGSGCSSFICPPYGDAPKAIVLNHISQLAPILETNKDVIAAVQMGFIGTWGENYYTDFFGDASSQGNGKLFDADWNNRGEVLAALLAAVPKERMVQVRYPQAKQRFIYGVNAPTNSAPLSSAGAYSGADIARIGFHNDCLLAGPDDFGTFADYGNDATSVNSDTTNLKPYFAADSRYVVVGGETCSDGYNPQNNCSGTNPAAFGDSELHRLHYSYLNTDYNQEVNNDWQSGGCMEEIKRSLGYRFELSSGSYPSAAQTNAPIDVNISLENVGYAAPFNERLVELILRETTSGEVWIAAMTDDPRNWQPENGNINFASSPCLPAAMPAGTYELLLNLPDPMPALHDRADYSIRLGSLLPGNMDGWEAATGYNKLGHQITVSGGGSGAGCNGAIFFVAENVSLPVELLAFTGEARGKQAELAWSTAREENHAYFGLERSNDAISFTEVTQITSAGNSETTRRYSYTDNDVAANNQYFYRLRSVDQDGTSSFSNIIQIRFAGVGNNELNVYPNPVSNQLELKWLGEAPASGQVLLLDQLGRILLDSPLSSSLNLERITPGTYLLRVESSTDSWTKKIVKQ